MSSIREKIYGKEDSNDVSENSITDALNVSDDLMLIFIKLITTLTIGLAFTVLVGRIANVNGVTAFNDILRVAMTIFIVGIILTLSLLIFVYNMAGLVITMISFGKIDIPKFELQSTTEMLIELLYQFVIS